MKYLSGWRIELGELESNEKFHEDGGWINGTLTNGVVSFNVGGGWIHNEQSANHYNNCHGYSYSGGGPNPYRQALSAGGFESYKGNELGDIEGVFEHFGFNVEDNPEECEVIEAEIIELSNRAWNDLDLGQDIDYQALIHTDEEVISNLKEAIEEDNVDCAKIFAEIAKLKKIEFEIEEVSEDDNESDGVIYKTVNRNLVANSIKIASFSICAQGWYVNNKNNPNYHIGWNVDENTDGGDGIRGALEDVLDELNSLDKAKELPDIEEPAHEEPDPEGEYIVQVKNTYTQGMEDWNNLARFATETGAQFYIDQFWRDFYDANSSNSYGPETRIMYQSEEISAEV